MNKTLTLALAAALSTAPLGGIAIAQTTSSTTTALADDMVSIVNITEASDSDDATTQIPEEPRNPTSDVTAQAQAEIQADPALMTALEDKTVELQNVVSSEERRVGNECVGTWRSRWS